MNNKVKLSDYVSEFLSEHTSYAFVGQGSSVIHLLDSIEKNERIQNIPSQNEQGASLAADAYSRVSGNIGLSIATSGPGILNLLQGMGCSFFDSIPTLFISGAVPRGQQRKNKNVRQVGFQEMEVVDIVKPLSKYAVLLKDPKMIKYELEKLIYYAKEGRPGPVVLDLPDDIQREYIDPSELKSFTIPEKKLPNIQKGIEKVLVLISNSKSPVIIFGNGIKIAKAEKELDIFIKKSGIPFAPTWATVDLYNSNEKDLIGIFGVAASRYGNFTIQSSDLLICLGTRLNSQLIGSKPETFAPKAKKIIVDIDEAEFTKGLLNYDMEFNICVKEFLNELNKHDIKTNELSLSKWKKKINNLKIKYPLCEQKYYDEKKFVNPYVFFNELSLICDENDILMPDASANLIWAYQSFKPKKGQLIFTALNHSPMGYSMAAAVGAQYASENRRVIATIGDGSMAMNIQELETISYNKLPIKIFVLNNKGYGLIKGTQELFLDKNYVGVDPSSGLGIPDFKKISDSYNIKYEKISNNFKIKDKIKFILDFKGPILCDLILDPNQRVIPKLQFGKPIHDLSPLLDEKVIKEDLFFE